MPSRFVRQVEVGASVPGYASAMRMRRDRSATGSESMRA